MFTAAVAAFLHLDFIIDATSITDMDSMGMTAIMEAAITATTPALTAAVMVAAVTGDESMPKFAWWPEGG
jgi:hypothetical protein